MTIAVPRVLIVGLAAMFSVYILVLAATSLDVPRMKGPYVAAMLIFAAAMAISLWPSSGRMPIWMASVNVLVAAALPLLVTAQLDVTRIGADYSTWYVAAIGVLMVVTSTRRRHTFAWIGVVVLVGQTVAWAGPGALTTLGVVGSVLWVGVSHAVSASLTKAGRDARQYGAAEREAAEWQAAQEAHVFERQFRLRQTSRMALPMLRQIAATGGDLTEDQRRECLHLEGAIRDEIRGRRLLNDRVREQVMRARRRGTAVSLLDEGGLDELSDEELEDVLNQLADAINGTTTDRLIVRTVPEGSDVAVTVVGIRSSDDGSASALGHADGDEGDDEVDIWLEIPRPKSDVPVEARAS